MTPPERNAPQAFGDADQSYAQVAIGPGELATALTSDRPPTVLDVTFNLGGPPGRLAYDAAHIPGAVFADLETVFSAEPRTGRASVSSGGGRHPLPDPSVTQSHLRAAGVRDGEPIVVYDAGNSLAAARAWFVLRLFGVPDVRVLDGGLAGWRATGGSVTTVVPDLEPGDLQLAAEPAFEVLDADAAGEWQGVLLDARAPERFAGDVEPMDPVAGHIPGARNLPMAELLRADGRLLPATVLDRRFAEAGADGERPVAAYCGSGITAAHTAWAYARLGRSCKVYAGSWSDWIIDPDRPVATGR